MRHFLYGDFQYAILLYGFDTMTSIIASSLSLPNNNNNTNVVVYVVLGSSSKASTKNNTHLYDGSVGTRERCLHTLRRRRRRRRRRQRRREEQEEEGGGMRRKAMVDATMPRVRGSERVRVAPSNAEASRRSVVLQTISRRPLDGIFGHCHRCFRG